MSNIIILSDKINELNQIREALEKEKKSLFNKRITFKLNHYELFVLIEKLSGYLISLNDYSRESLNEEYCEDTIKGYNKEAKLLAMLIKRLYSKFICNDGFSDEIIKLSLNDLYNCIVALESWIDIYPIRDRKRNVFYFKRDYNDKDKFNKTMLYLYKILKDKETEIEDKLREIRIKQEKQKRKRVKNRNQLFIAATSSTTMFTDEPRDKYQELLKYYRDSYIKEFHSEVKFIYESTSYLDNKAVWNTYYIKAKDSFIKRLHLDNYSIESNFVYYNDYEIEQNKLSSKFKVEYFPEGWRFCASIPTKETYDEYLNGDCVSYIDYDKYTDLYIINQIESSPEMEDINFEIISYEKKREVYYVFKDLKEHLRYLFEEIVEIYSQYDNLIDNRRIISYEFSKLLDNYYQY